MSWYSFYSCYEYKVLKIARAPTDFLPQQCLCLESVPFRLLILAFIHLVHLRCLMEDVPCFWYLLPLLSHLSTWICSLVLNSLEAIRDIIWKVSSLKMQLLSNVIILYRLCLARTGGSSTDCLKEYVYGFPCSDSWILEGWVSFKALNNLTLNEKENSSTMLFILSFWNLVCRLVL